MKLKSALLISSISLVLSACGGPSENEKPPKVTLDNTPNAFSFTAVEGATPTTWVESEVVEITGINTEVDVTIEGGEYSIDGQPFTSSSGVINNNQSLKVRLQAAEEDHMLTQSTVTIGDVTATFEVVSGVLKIVFIGDDAQYGNEFYLTSLNDSEPTLIKDLVTKAPTLKSIELEPDAVYYKNHLYFAFYDHILVFNPENDELKKVLEVEQLPYSQQAAIYEDKLLNKSLSSLKVVEDEIEFTLDNRDNSKNSYKLSGNLDSIKYIKTQSERTLSYSQHSLNGYNYVLETVTYDSYDYGPTVAVQFSKTVPGNSISEFFTSRDCLGDSYDDLDSFYVSKLYYFANTFYFSFGCPSNSLVKSYQYDDIKGFEPLSNKTYGFENKKILGLFGQFLVFASASQILTIDEQGQFEAKYTLGNTSKLDSNVVIDKHNRIYWLDDSGQLWMLPSLKTSPILVSNKLNANVIQSVKSFENHVIIELENVGLVYIGINSDGSISQYEQSLHDLMLSDDKLTSKLLVSNNDYSYFAINNDKTNERSFWQSSIKDNQLQIVPLSKVASNLPDNFSSVEKMVPNSSLDKAYFYLRETGTVEFQLYSLDIATAEFELEKRFNHSDFKMPGICAKKVYRVKESVYAQSCKDDASFYETNGKVDSSKLEFKSQFKNLNPNEEAVNKHGGNLYYIKEEVETHYDVNGIPYYSYSYCLNFLDGIEDTEIQCNYSHTRHHLFASSNSIGFVNYDFFDSFDNNNKQTRINMKDFFVREHSFKDLYDTQLFSSETSSKVYLVSKTEVSVFDDISKSVTNLLQSSAISESFLSKNNLIFVKDNSEVWVSDGSLNGTENILNVSNLLGKIKVFSLNGKYFLTIYNELFEINGEQLVSLGFIGHNEDANFTAALTDDVLFFVTDTEIYSLNPKSQLTNVTQGLNLKGIVSNNIKTLGSNSILFFTKAETHNRFKLWYTNENIASTKLLSGDLNILRPDVSIH